MASHQLCQLVDQQTCPLGSIAWEGTFKGKLKSLPGVVSCCLYLPPLPKRIPRAAYWPCVMKRSVCLAEEPKLMGKADSQGCKVGMGKGRCPSF